MSDTIFLRLLDLTAGLVLVCAFVALWRRALTAVVRALAVQGAALAAVALLVGLHEHHLEIVVAAGLVLVLKAGVVPVVLGRIVRASGETREPDPLVNVPASLLIGAVLTLVAYSATRGVVALDPAPQTHALPIGLAVVLIGFFVLATRRKAVSQIMGFLLIDNGIALVAFLATSGVPLVVEFGVAVDVLLVVLILQVLAAQLHTSLGFTDLDRLRELHD